MGCSMGGEEEWVVGSKVSTDWRRQRPHLVTCGVRHMEQRGSGHCYKERRSEREVVG